MKAKQEELRKDMGENNENRIERKGILKKKKNSNKTNFIRKCYHKNSANGFEEIVQNGRE